MGRKRDLTEKEVTMVYSRYNRQSKKNPLGYQDEPYDEV